MAGQHNGQEAELWTGGWWRFSRYEIRDGAIRPVEDAQLEWYDPWELHRTSAWDTGTSPPYQSLIALLLSLGAFFDEAHTTWRLVKGVDNRSSMCLDEGFLTSSEHDKILNWCNRFGLLGILPHAALTIGLPVRRGHHLGKGIYFRRSRVRLNGKWISHIEAVFSKTGIKDRELFSKALELLDEDEPQLGSFLRKTNRYYQMPMVAFSLRPGLASSPKGEIPISAILNTFFPDYENKRDRFECPRPLTPEFWRIYSEPVDDFLRYALAFVTAVEPIAAHRSSASPTASALGKSDPVALG
jgi:hypothetical protein